MSRYRTSSSSGSSGIFSCGCLILILVINLILGAWSVNFILPHVGGRAIAFWPAVIIGMFAGEITIPVAVIWSLLIWAGAF